MRLISLSILFILLMTSCAKRPAYPEAPVSGETITIDIKTLKEETPVFYSMRHKGKIIVFFVVKIKGEAQSYFDACARCYPEKLGYRVDGQYVICRKCDIRYSMESLKAGFGSCYPIALRGKTEGGKYLIDKKTVMEGEKLF
ncbi:MAG: DUF2318 domain-containing protein [Nitrospirae bacterium]|nr:MAG: DUF2318 domain-containing protein [Nitrospirota bacterium]